MKRKLRRPSESATGVVVLATARTPTRCSSRTRANTCVLSPRRERRSSEAEASRGGVGPVPRCLRRSRGDRRPERADRTSPTQPPRSIRAFCRADQRLPSVLSSSERRSQMEAGSGHLRSSATPVTPRACERVESPMRPRSPPPVPAPPGLLDRGRGLPVPPNVWFFGTLLRDPSSYPLSERVLDRAVVLPLGRHATRLPAAFQPLEMGAESILQGLSVPLEDGGLPRASRPAPEGAGGSGLGRLRGSDWTSQQDSGTQDDDRDGRARRGSVS